jgi:hypothetical protein
MTLLRNQVVKAECPGCHKSLKIPANWISEPMKCKHCGLVFQAKAPQAGSSKSAKPAPLMSRPFAPPPGVAMGIPAGPPVARPASPIVAGVPTAAPVAIPVGGMAVGNVPTAAGIPVGVPGGPKRLTAVKRRSRGVMQKLVFLLVFVLGLGSIALVMYNMVPGLNGEGTEVASVGTDKDTSASKTEPMPSTAAPTTPSKVVTRPLPPTRGIFDQTRRTLPERPKVVTRPEEPEAKTKDPKPIFPPKVTRPNRPKEPQPEMTKPVEMPADPPVKPVETTGVPKGSYPRRLLAISVNNYPYANPVSYGSNDRAMENVVRQFAELMKVPDDQVSLLSDRGRLPLTAPAVPPAKEVVEQVVTDFLGKSRAQDRIMLLFVGHCVEVEDTPYLVPLEGEKENKDSLIALDWLYAKLAACPAQQKVLILDVCRFDPGRGEERGTVPPMGEKTDAMLAKPPKGVQVLTACVAGQRSLEMTDRLTSSGLIDGGVLLNQIPIIRAAGGLRGVTQKPDDPYPLDELMIKFKSGTSAMAKAFLRLEQTPRLSGEPTKTLPFDAKAALPPSVLAKMPDKYKNGVVGANDLEKLFTLTNRIPAVKESDKGKPFRFESLPPYPKDSIKEYTDDGMDTPLRAAIDDGVKALIASDQSRDLQIRETFDKPQNEQALNAVKKQIEGIQKEKVGEELFRLGKVIEELEARVESVAKDTKLWQARYKYVLARLYQRQAYVLEYTAMLGKIRKDELPQLDPKINKGWRLAAKKDMSDKDGKDLAEKSRKLLDEVAKDHKGTPWELMAKREAITALGMEWQPN